MIDVLDRAGELVRDVVVQRRDQFLFRHETTSFLSTLFPDPGSKPRPRLFSSGDFFLFYRSNRGGKVTAIRLPLAGRLHSRNNNDSG
jgi:hypothetical protein